WGRAGVRAPGDIAPSPQPSPTGGGGQIPPSPPVEEGQGGRTTPPREKMVPDRPGGSESESPGQPSSVGLSVPGATPGTGSVLTIPNERTLELVVACGPK